MAQLLPSEILNPDAPDNPPWWGLAIMALLLALALALAAWFQVKMRRHKRARRQG